MFRFQCEWVDGQTTSARSGYELGHMSFAGEAGLCTSRGKVPDQAMMICLALVELLDGLRRFLVERQVEYTFVGTDSSFSVQFRRGGKGGLPSAVARPSWERWKAPTCAEPSCRASSRFWGNQETHSLATLPFARICSRPSQSLPAFAYETAVNASRVGSGRAPAVGGVLLAPVPRPA